MIGIVNIPQRRSCIQNEVHKNEVSKTEYTPETKEEQISFSLDLLSEYHCRPLIQSHYVLYSSSFYFIVTRKQTILNPSC